jgi:hypothetical protein
MHETNDMTNETIWSATPIEQEVADWLVNEYTTPELAPPVTEAMPEVGALQEWWNELRDGLRTKYDMDDLWRAACAEASARDAVRDRLFAAATEDRLRAAEMLVQAEAEVTP